MATLDPVAFADLLAGWCLDVREGEQVLARSTTLAEPVLLAFHAAVLDRGAWPFLRVELPGQGRAFYEHAREWQLDDVADLSITEAKRIAKSVAIQAPHDPAELAGIDPARIGRVQRSRAVIREITLKRRWCSTLWPTESLAARAGMSLPQLEAFVARALFLDRPAGPVTAWRELGAFQARLIERLEPARTIRIEADGTDLTLGVKGRRWINSDGKRNMPSGEVFTGPHETSANGTIRFDLPTTPAGITVRGVELELRDGEVVRGHAEEGDAYLQQVLRTDDGARRIGELGLGTNYGIDRPIGTILFDEKIGGTVHLALGRSYPETGGRNLSAVHWDLICDLREGGRLTADGVVVQQDGRFA